MRCAGPTDEPRLDGPLCSRQTAGTTPPPKRHSQTSSVSDSTASFRGRSPPYGRATVVGGAAPHRQPHTAVVFGSVAARPIGETRAAPSKSVRDADRPDHSYRPAPPRPVAAAVSIGGNHEGAAAPSGATARVTVR